MSKYSSDDSSISPKFTKDADNFDGKSEYAKTSKLSFQDLLKFHHKTTVWGFQFGKEVRETTLKNMQEKQTCESIASVDETETVVDEDKAGTSQSITEKDHKTPHSRKRIEVGRTSKRKNSTKQTDFVSPQKTRKAPLPLMDWADSKEVRFFYSCAK